MMIRYGVRTPLCLMAIWASLASVTSADLHVFKKREGEALDPSRHRRVALLVVRVGSIKPFDLLAPITEKTDYAARTPKARKVDVCIEDETRARQSLPLFPKYKSNRIPVIRATYFRNITIPLYKGVASLLRERGFEVLDVGELSRSWPTPLFEMDVAAIIRRLEKEADAVLIVHYRDVANYTYDSVRDRTTETGLSMLMYTLSAFEAPDGRRFLFVKCDGSSVMSALRFDPMVIADPRLRAKVQVTEAGGTTEVRYSFTEDEVIERGIGYVCHGVEYAHPLMERVHWNGLDKLLF